MQSFSKVTYRVLDKFWILPSLLSHPLFVFTFDDGVHRPRSSFFDDSIQFFQRNRLTVGESNRRRQLASLIVGSKIGDLFGARQRLVAGTFKVRVQSLDEPREISI